MDPNFRKDVLQDIIKEKENINAQIAALEPLKNELHTSVGSRIVKTGSYYFLQFICWIFILALIAWLIFMFKISPFFELSNLLHTAAQSNPTSLQDVNYATWAIRFIVLGLIVLIIVIERQLNALRKKDKISSLAGKTMATIQSQLEERMNTLIAFESKYNYLLQGDIKIELDQFTNPLPPPEGDTLLD